MKLFWTKEALLRLRENEKYISRDNPAAAVEFIDKLITHAEKIPDNAEKGRIVPELSMRDLRELVNRYYRIVYLVRKNSVDILTVFEGHQLLKKEELIKTKK